MIKDQIGRPGPASAILGLAAIGLALAACSSASAGPHVASLPGHSGRPAARGTLTTAQADRDFIRFARCMRGHGVAMSDPFHRPGHPGLSIQFPTQTQANRPAFAACNHFIEPVIQRKDSNSRPVADLHALTQYAQCMRGHDIAMLDPTTFGALNLGTVPGITSGFGRYSPQFRAADAACRHFLPAYVHDNGTGP